MTVLAFDGADYISASGGAPVACFAAPQGGVFSHLRLVFDGLDASAVTWSGSVSVLEELEVTLLDLDGTVLSQTTLRQFGRCETESYLVPEVRLRMPVDDPVELDGVEAELAIAVEGDGWSFGDRLPIRIVAASFH